MIDKTANLVVTVRDSRISPFRPSSHDTLASPPVPAASLPAATTPCDRLKDHSINAKARAARDPLQEAIVA